MPDLFFGYTFTSDRATPSVLIFDFHREPFPIKQYPPKDDEEKVYDHLTTHPCIFVEIEAVEKHTNILPDNC